MIQARNEYRSYVLGREHDSKVDKARVAIQLEDSINERARELFDSFAAYGVKWSACVQAVKTDWVSSFLTKWGEIRKEAKAKEAKGKEKEVKVGEQKRKDFKRDPRKEHKKPVTVVTATK